MIRRAAIGILAIALIALAAAPANAEPFDERPCTGNLWTDDLLWWPEPDRAWDIYATCPDGYTISLSRELQTGEFGGGEAHENFQDAPITRISAWMSGSNGSEAGYTQGLLACRLSVCSEILTIPDAAEPNGAWVSLEAEDIPAGANRVVARGVCFAGPCTPGGDPLHVANLSITREDDTPPFMEVKEISRGIDENGDETVELVDFDETQWRSGLIEFADDPGVDLESYILYLQVNVGSIEYCVPSTYVYMNPPNCEMKDEYFVPQVHTDDLDDGANTLTVKLVNGAGLFATDSVELLTDKTAPAKPVSLQVTPRRNNWSRESEVRIDWTNPGETVTTDTQSGLAAVEYDVDPILAGAHPPEPAVDPDPVVHEDYAVDSLSLSLPGQGEWSVTLRTIDKAGNPSPWATTDIKVDSATPSAPILAAVDPIGKANVQTGRTFEWTREADPISGICGTDYAINRQSAFNPGEDPDSPAVAGAATSAFVPGSVLGALDEGLNYLHVRTYSCAGKPGLIDRVPLMVDLTLPTVIASLEDDPAIDGDERVNISASDVNGNAPQSGVRSITYAVNGASTTIDAPSDSIELPAGVVTLEYFATDNVGNRSDTARMDFTIDRTDPFGTIELGSPADPARVDAVISDTDSGIAEASLEFRPIAGGPWTRAGERFKPAAPQFGIVRFSAALPYEDSIPDGDYMMQLTLVDGSGRVAHLTTRATGQPATFRSPLRILPTLTAGLRPTRGTGTALAKLTVDYGKSVRLAGRLTSPSGEPIAGARLEVVAERAGALRVPIANLATDSAGNYSTPIAPGTSRTLTVRFAGDQRFRATDAVAKVFVRGRITLRIDKRRIRSGRRAILRGKVYGDVLPARGKPVRIEFLVGRRVSSLALKARANAAGIFEVRFNPKARRTVRYRMRAVTDAELGWPYESARSATVTLTVTRR